MNQTLQTLKQSSYQPLNREDVTNITFSATVLYMVQYYGKNHVGEGLRRTGGSPSPLCSSFECPPGFWWNSLHREDLKRFFQLSRNVRQKKKYYGSLAWFEENKTVGNQSVRLQLKLGLSRITALISFSKQSNPFRENHGRWHFFSHRKSMGDGMLYRCAVHGATLFHSAKKQNRTVSTVL